MIADRILCDAVTSRSERPAQTGHVNYFAARQEENRCVMSAARA